MGELVACLARDGVDLPRDVVIRVTGQSSQLDPAGIVHRGSGQVALAHSAVHSTPECSTEGQLVERDGGASAWSPTPASTTARSCLSNSTRC